MEAGPDREREGSIEEVADLQASAEGGATTDFIRSTARHTVAAAVEAQESAVVLNIDYSRFDKTLLSLARELKKCEVPQSKKINIPGRVDLWRILPEQDAEKLASVFKYKRRNCLRNYPDDPARFPHPDHYCPVKSLS